MYSLVYLWKKGRDKNIQCIHFSIKMQGKTITPLPPPIIKVASSLVCIWDGDVEVDGVGVRSLMPSLFNVILMFECTTYLEINHCESESDLRSK